MRIGFDFNGVVADSSTTKIEVAERFFDRSLDAANTARRSLGQALTPDEYDTLQKMVFWTSEALRTPPVPGALKGLGRVATLDNVSDIIFVTCLAPEGVQFGRQWLAEHEQSRGSLFSVGRGGEKAWVLRAGFDVYVDDKGSVLNGLEGIVPHRFLLTTPYNQRDGLNEGVIRVEDWQHLEEEVARVAAQN